MPQRQKTNAETTQPVDQTGLAGKLTECYEPRCRGFAVLPHALIIDQLDVVLEASVEEWHILRLCLHCVREHHVCLAWKQLTNWHLLDTKDCAGT